MLNIPKSCVVLRALRIRNPVEQPLVVWIEPWAERHELTCDGSLDVVIAGPDPGLPEVIPGPHGITIYGWEGSEAFTFHDGQPAGARPSVADIVRQELKVAGARIEFLRAGPPVGEITMAQHVLDATASNGPDSSGDVLQMVGLFVYELSESLKPSEAAATLLWLIGSRILETRGVTLAIAEPPWCGSLAGWRTAIEQNAIILVPEFPSHSASSTVKQPHAGYRNSEGLS